MLPEAAPRRASSSAAPPARGPRRPRLPASAGVLGWALLPAVLVLVLSRRSWSGAFGSPPFLVLAFWAAVAEFERRGGGHADDALRLALGLGLGALLAHLGWALLHAPVVAESPRILLEARGFSSLFLPLGVLALAPRRGDRSRFLAPALGCLALGLAVARLGCIPAGCCRGAATDAFWAIAGRHPTRWLEWAGLVALCLGTTRVPRSLVAPVTLAGFGALRLALGPLREADPAGPALLPPAWLAAAWLLLGVGWALCQSRSRLAPSSRTLP